MSKKGFGIFKMLSAAVAMAMMPLRGRQKKDPVPNVIDYHSPGNWWNRTKSISDGSNGKDGKLIRRREKKRMGNISRRRNHKWPSYK